MEIGDLLRAVSSGFYDDSEGEGLGAIVFDGDFLVTRVGTRTRVDWVE
jgi:hypothetical protein